MLYKCYVNTRIRLLWIYVCEKIDKIKRKTQEADHIPIFILMLQLCYFSY